MDESRAKRMAANEALFRHANEALRKSDDQILAIAGFLCECADPQCEEKLSASGSTYLKVRTDPARFLVVAGHADSEIEKVVEEHDGFHVIEKIGPGREVAERLAPRRL